MPDWLTGAMLAIVVSGLAGVLFSALASWMRFRREIRFKVGAAHLELRPNDVRMSLDRLQEAASELRQHPTVLLSYAGPDREFAQRLVADLEEAGVHVWFGDREIAVGDRLPGKIAEALDASQWVVMVLSPGAMQSKWLQVELELALREESRRQRSLVLPALYRGESPPAVLRDRVYADFRSSYDAGFQSLLRAIRRQSPEPLEL